MVNYTQLCYRIAMLKLTQEKIHGIFIIAKLLHFVVVSKSTIHFLELYNFPPGMQDMLFAKHFTHVSFNIYDTCVIIVECSRKVFKTHQLIKIHYCKSGGGGCAPDMVPTLLIVDHEQLLSVFVNDLYRE